MAAPKESYGYMHTTHSLCLGIRQGRWTVIGDQRGRTVISHEEDGQASVTKEVENSTNAVAARKMDSHPFSTLYAKT